MIARKFLILLCFLVLAGCLAACGDDKKNNGGDELTSQLGYDEASGEVVVILNRDLGSSETLRARVRSLAEGDQLDCSSMAGQMQPLAVDAGEHAYAGLSVEPTVFENPTTAESLLGETEAAYQERIENTFFVEVCVTDENGVVHAARYDIRQALDVRGENGKFDAFDDGVKIVSNQAYAEACIEDMGDIPFWGPRISEEGEPDWGTVNCVEIATPIPSTIDGEPVSEKVPQCDQPQYIYRHCEADARTGANGPRVAHARNEQGTHWVLLCRKAHDAEGRYEDMAMIGHNPFTGQTCFFQNQLPAGETPRPSNNGMEIPHPADNIKSEASPQMWSDLWGGIEGGTGSNGGIQCQGCHSTDPFIHTPWIDGAVDEDGDPIVPKMGHNPDFVEGYNGPYRILDAEDQGWSAPKVLVSEEASACTRCHRVGLDQWTADSSISSRRNEDGGCVFCAQAPWLDRLEQGDDSWENLVTESHKSFDKAFWMPPNAEEVLNEDLWPESDYKQAMDFIRMCGREPDNEACVWEALPEEPGDPTELPVIEETGEELAKEALATLGAPYLDGETEVEATRRCGECHATSKLGLRDWRERTQEAQLAGLDVRADIEDLDTDAARELVNYMRRGEEGTVFAAYKLGIYSPGVQFPWFQQLFQKAYGANWGIEYGAFLQRVSMPKGSHPPLSAREFAVVLKWFTEDNLAHIDDLLIEVPPPATCGEVESRYGVGSTPAPWLATHIEDMQFEGWAAVNQENGINMYGCSDGNALNCFDNAKVQSEWLDSEGIPGSRLLEIKELSFNTSFWMRSSADGRFVGNGGGSVSGFGATITDLATENDIGVKGSYDPGFFPNNDGFIMQGGGAGLCGQSVLTREEAIADGIDFTEEGCSRAEGINLYQHVAVDLNGGDYFIINSQFTSDSGSADKDPRAPFSETSTMKFNPLVFDGSEWQQKDAVIVDSPYEGDSVLSPSGRVVVSRFAGPDGTALGYMLRRVVATPNAEGSYDIDISQPGQFICAPGAKANISYDERFMVTHVYENDTANLYLTDLTTGATARVTNMPADRKALFPHFRSDGWLYFLVTGGEGPDLAMASDAALVLANQ